MKPKNFLLIVILTMTVSIYSRQVVRAGGPSSPPTISGTANIRGVVRFAGAAPPPKPISMSADPSCAKQHTSPVFTQEVAVDSKGDLQNVVVFVSDGLGVRTFEAPAQPIVIEQKGCLYQPHVVAMQANQPLHVVNDDPTSHNIHPTPVNNREWNKAQPPGTALDESFAREEVSIPVKCNVHPWMHSYIAVFKHPYFAVTGKDGSFDLNGLPAGTYTVKAWHEKLGTSTQTITIGANEMKELNFVFKSL